MNVERYNIRNQALAIRLSLSDKNLDNILDEELAQEEKEQEVINAWEELMGELNG